MNQSENTKRRYLAIVGVVIFVATVAITFQNCSSAVEPANGQPTSLGINTPTPSPTPPGSTPTPTPTATPPTVGVFTATSLTGSPTARCQATSTSTGTGFFVWGGVTPNVAMPTDGGILNASTNSWAPVSSSNAPGPRNFATAVFTGTQVIVWGGSYTSNLNTGGIYTIGTNSWTATSTTNAPVGRYNHAAVWTGSKMIIWGGSSMTGTTESFLTSGGIFDPATNTWTAMSTTNAPTTAGIASGTWTGSKFVVWGGAHGSQGGIYDPVTNTWTAITTSGAPGARDAHFVFWNGSKVVVWGGYKNVNGSNFFDNTGALLDIATNTWVATSMTNVPAGAIDRSMAVSGAKLYAYEPQITAGAIYDSVLNTWATMNPVGGLTTRFSHTSGFAGTSYVSWGGCINNGGVASGYNTGTLYQ